MILATVALTAFLASSVPLNPANAQKMLSPGINLGNTLEAIPKETSWGNPVPNLAYFRAVRAAGFKSVRIPVAWTQYADSENRIGSAWMAHVTDTVKMAESAGLAVLINVHWDGGWIQALPDRQQSVQKKLRQFWKQIALNFRDFDDRLMFAGTNEIGVDGVYGMPKPENADVQNSYNQLFVDVVRSTGGRNSDRILVVQGYNTDIDTAVKVNLTLPKDSAKGRLMMEVHYYSPYNFVLNDKSDVWQWGRNAKDKKFTDTWGNEEYVDGEFEKIKASFLDRGIPVILGEYSCGMKQRFPGMNAYRLDWDEYVTQSAYRRGLIPMLWDTGSAFDRTTGAVKDSELVRRIIQAAK